MLSNQISYERVHFLFQNVQGILSLFGIVSNILTICVLSRKMLNKYSYSFYCRAMAFSDTFLLSHLLIRLIITIFLDGIIEEKSERWPFYYCSKDFLGYLNGTISLWLLTLISFDRYLTVAHPNHFALFKRRWTQFVLLAIVIIYSFALNITLPINVRYELIDFGNGIVKPICYVPYKIQSVHSWIILANFFLVNMVLNNFLNYKIIRCIIRSRRRSMGQHLLRKRDRKFAICSIVLNILSFVMRAPIPLGFLISHYFKFDPDLTRLAFTISLTIATLDHSFTLIVNTVISSLFYRELLSMFGFKSEYLLARA